MVYQAGRHNLDNNKLRFTPIHTIIVVGVRALRVGGSSKSQAEKYLQAQYGRSSRSVAQRWVTAGEILGGQKDVQEQLRQMPYLKPAYVVTNNFFCGLASSAKERLTSPYAIAALRYLQQEAEDTENGELMPQTTAKQFVEVTCRSFKFLELWEKTTLRKFGESCLNFPSFKRMLDHLKTASGLKKVHACMTSKVQLHGSSEQEPGIRECRDIYLQLQKCKAGQPPASTDHAGVLQHPPVSADLDGVANAQIVDDQDLAFLCV